MDAETWQKYVSHLSKKRWKKRWKKKVELIIYIFFHFYGIPEKLIYLFKQEKRMYARFFLF